MYMWIILLFIIFHWMWVITKIVLMGGGNKLTYEDSLEEEGHWILL